MTTFRYINEHDTSASYGLAADEFLMHMHQEHQTDYASTLRLYNYKDYSVLAGRFQDLAAEIDVEACNRKGFEVGRRLTGGGAILMGSGQLGICLATSAKTYPWEHVSELYRLFAQPVIDALLKLGINASFRGKNDLEVNGKKIAGLGVYVDASGAIQFHTSLLVELDTSQMLEVLKIPIQKYADNKKIASIEQRITTINREIGRPVSMQEVTQLVKESFAKAFMANFHHQPFKAAEKEAIQQIERSRYLTKTWLFQNSPQKDMTGMSLKKTPAGLLRTYIGLKGEIIKSVLITGDFFEQSELLSQIESELKWAPLDKEIIGKAVAKVLSDSVASTSDKLLSPAVVTEAIWLAAQRAMAAERYTYKGSCYYPKIEHNNQQLVEN